MSYNVILSVHTNLIEVAKEEVCHACKNKKSEVLLHGKRLCFDCAYIELGVSYNPKVEQMALSAD